MVLESLEYRWKHPILLKAMTGEVVEGADWKDVRDLVTVYLNILEKHGRFEEYLNLARLSGYLTEYLVMLVHVGKVEEAYHEGLEKISTIDASFTLAKKICRSRFI